MNILTKDDAVITGEKLLFPTVNFLTVISGDWFRHMFWKLLFCGQRLLGEIPFPKFNVSSFFGVDSWRPGDPSIEICSWVTSPSDNLSAPRKQWPNCKREEWYYVKAPYCQLSLLYLFISVRWVKFYFTYWHNSYHIELFASSTLPD